MDVFKETNYKTIIKKRVRELAGQGRPINLSRLATRIGIQYTYLSKVLNHDNIHLNEDHLYEVCNYLNFLPNESDYLSLLRSYGATSNPHRRQTLQNRISSLQSELELKGQRISGATLSGEIHFMLSPLVWLSHFALELQHIRENPRKLASLLGITIPQLKNVLHTLNDLALIEIDGDIFKIKDVKKNHFHYGPDHPLMRVHQQMLQKFCESQIMKLPEGEKTRVQLTFNSDEKTVGEIKKLFQNFICEAEKLILPSKSASTYQLNFDLFRWF